MHGEIPSQIYYYLHCHHILYQQQRLLTKGEFLIFFLSTIGWKSMIISCLVGALLILIEHTIWDSTTSTPVDNFRYFLCRFYFVCIINIVKHWIDCLNPDESIPMNNLLILTSNTTTNEEIIFSNIVPLLTLPSSKLLKSSIMGNIW